MRFHSRTQAPTESPKDVLQGSAIRTINWQEQAKKAPPLPASDLQALTPKTPPQRTKKTSALSQQLHDNPKSTNPYSEFAQWVCPLAATTRGLACFPLLPEMLTHQ